MAEFMTFLIMSLILTISALAYVTYLYFHNKETREYTKRCLDIDNRAFSLLDYLFIVLRRSETKEKIWYIPHADKLFTIERQYWLKRDDDEKIVEAILNEYKKSMCENYFKGIFRFGISKKTEAEYFLLTLGDFLYYERKEEDTYKKISDTVDKDHFWLVYYKMRLICIVYYLAMRSDPYNRTTTNYNEMLEMKKLIEKHQAKIKANDEEVHSEERQSGRAYIYATAANGIEVRIPADRYEQWKAAQDLIRKGQKPLSDSDTTN